MPLLVSQACHGETRRDKIDPQAQLPGVGGSGGGSGGVELGGLFCPFSFPHDKPAPEAPFF